MPWPPNRPPRAQRPARARAPKLRRARALALALWALAAGGPSGCLDGPGAEGERRDSAAPLDADPSDAAPSDLGPTDAQRGDRGPPDADLGPPDDLGLADLGPPDAATADDGPPDLGPPDLGPPDLGPEAITLQGRVTFEDRPVTADGLGAPTPAPARHLRIEALDAADGVLAAGLTDAAGEYRLRFDPPAAAPSVRVQVRAAVAVGSLDAEVRDRTHQQALYALVSDAVPAAPGARLDLDLHAAAAQAVGAALHVADTVGVALAAIDAAAPGRPAPTLTVRWQPGRAFDCGSCYGRDVVSLGGGLEDTDEFDDDIILHEVGHWFVHRFSADDSPGGAHRDRQVEPRLAYGEGLAYFFAALLRDTPLSIDTFRDRNRVIDLEAVSAGGRVTADLRGTRDGTAQGHHREEIVAGVLWDAYDTYDPQEPFDTVAIGRAGHFRIWLDDFPGRSRRPDVGARGIDLADWLVALACLLGTSTEGGAPEDPAPDDPAPEDPAPGDPAPPAEPAAQAGALAEALDYPFSPEDAVAEGACAEKGRQRPPFALVARDGQVWLEAAAPGAHADPGVADPTTPPPPLATAHGLRLYAGDAPPRALAGPLPLALGPDTPEAEYVVTRPGVAFTGASHLGAARRARRLGGTLVPGQPPLRRYPSQPAPR